MIIYGLRAPGDWEIRYVGATQNLKKRLKGHRADRQPCHRVNWIRSLAEMGQIPEAFVLQGNLCESTWGAAERFWIKYYKELGHRLTNATDGGDGMRGMSAEARARIGNANRRRAGIPLTAEHRRKIGLALKWKTGWRKGKKGWSGGWPSGCIPWNKGKHLSDEQKRKLSLAF